MANLFRNIAISRQQLRFLPRYSQSWPEKNIISKNTLQGREEVEKIDMVTKETMPQESLKQSNYPKIKWKHTSEQSPSLVIKAHKDNHHVKPEKSQRLKKIKVKVNDSPIKDEQGNFIYTKMDNNDIRISKIMADLKSGNKRKEVMLLEGKRLIKEALETGCKLEYILFSRMKEVEYLEPYLPKSGQLFKMPYKEMQTWSDLSTNPGIMGIFKIPPSDFFEPKGALPLTIICDNVREPNNLGAILRTSCGVGCEQLLLTKGCANVWESKVLRSACGAHFKVKLSKEVNWDDIRSQLPEKSIVFIADNNTVSTTGESVDSIENLAAHVPILPYFSANFKSTSHIVLIIGGETEGISVESYKLAKDFNGVRLNVPLSNGVDSLNTGTALGIIAFEIKRQLTNLQAKAK